MERPYTRQMEQADAEVADLMAEGMTHDEACYESQRREELASGMESDRIVDEGRE